MTEASSIFQLWGCFGPSNNKLRRLRDEIAGDRMIGRWGNKDFVRRVNSDQRTEKWKLKLGRYFGGS